jgi:DNA-binding transcriptional regulator YiaG
MMKNLQGYYGLEYVTVEYRTDRIPASVLEEVENKVSRYIVEHRSPLRGVEIRFVRKTLGLSMAALAERLDVTAPTILNWERADGGRARLDRVSEVAVRALFAELLGVKISGKFSDLQGEDQPTPITIKAA